MVFYCISIWISWNIFLCLLNITCTCIFKWWQWSSCLTESTKSPSFPSELLILDKIYKLNILSKGWAFQKRVMRTLIWYPHFYDKISLIWVVISWSVFFPFSSNNLILWFTASDNPFRIFKQYFILLKVKVEVVIWLLIIPLESSNYTSFYWR